MKQKPLAQNGIPISVSLDQINEQEGSPIISADKSRLLFISSLAVIVGIVRCVWNRSA